MADTVSKEKRSEMMSRIRSRGTKLELTMKALLDGRVFRYQPKGIPGKPDFGNKRRKLAVFVDGCFWHACPKCYREPKTNTEFWRGHIGGTVERDKRVEAELRGAGYTIIRVWEHEVRKDKHAAAEKIARVIYHEAQNNNNTGAGG